MDIEQHLQLRSFYKPSLLPVAKSIGFAFLIHLLVFIYWQPLEKLTAVEVPSWINIKLIAGIEEHQEKLVEKDKYKTQIKTVETKKNKIDDIKKTGKVKEKIKKKIEKKPSTTKRKSNTFVKASSQPYSLENPKPFYPTAARRRGMQGIVLLSIAVNDKGTVDNINVIRSSGFKVLDRSALESVKQWRFMPASRGNIKVASIIELPIKFVLNDLKLN